MILVRVLLSLLIAVAFLPADTLLLRNGTRLDGTFIDGGNHAIRFAVGSQINSYSLTDIESIRFGNGQTADTPSTVSPQPANAPQSGYTRAPATAPDPAPQNAPANTSVAVAPAAVPSTAAQVPAGTQIVVRLIDDVNSERDNIGETYRASVDQNVIVNGQTVIPRGADATVALIDSQKSGKLEGKAVLTLDLKYIAIDGRTYDLSTSSVTEASGSRGARSAKVIGGAAALGAKIGRAHV